MMMRKYALVVLLASVAALLGLCISPKSCFGTNKRAPSFSVLQATSKRLSLPSIVWASKPWTGNDGLLINTRNQIDKQIADRQDSQALLEQYRSDAKANPRDPLKVFAWAYSARKALSPWMPYEDRVKTLTGVHQALLAAPFPNTYNYARIIFLIAEDDHRLVSVGERLLARDSSDVEVKVRLASDYSSLIAVEGAYKNRLDVNAERRTVALVDQLVQSDPQNPLYHSLKGLVYSGFYYTGKFTHPVDAQKSIAAYREYLRLAPQGAERSAKVEAVIKELQGEMTKAAR